MKKINHSRRYLNIHWVSILAILIVIVSPWFDRSVANHSFVKSYVTGIGIGILVLVVLWIKRHQKQLIFNVSWLKISWLSLFILGTLSIFWSVNSDFSITKWMIWFTIFCGFIVGYELNLSSQNLTKLVFGLLIAAFTIAAIGILQYLFDPFPLTQAAKPASTFGNKNMTTQPIILIWPLMLFLLFSNSIKDKQVWMITIFTSLILVFVFYTRTRSSWVAFVGEIILIAGFLFIKRKSLNDWISWNKNKTRAVLFSVVLLLLLININENGFVLFTDKISNAAEGFDSSGASRLKIWAVAIEMIKTSPLFGTGLGSWFHNESNAGFGTHDVMVYQRAHNDFLELGVELGIIGMALLLLSAVVTSIAIFKITAQDDKSKTWFYFLLWVVLVGSFIQMQFTFPYQLAMPSMLLGLYLGLIAKQSEKFIPPIKSITFKQPRFYRQSILSFWIVLMTIVSAIYMDWASTYSQLNYLNKTGQIHKVRTAIPTIYHLELPNILNFIGNAYLKTKNYGIVMQVEKQNLKYWPNSSVSLSRKTRALIKLERYDEALKTIERFKKVVAYGSFMPWIFEIQIYLKTQNTEKSHQAFLSLLKKDEKQLSLNKMTYMNLLQLSTKDSVLSKYSKMIYNKYNKYHSYSCHVENNMVVFYFNQQQFAKAKQHIDAIKKNNGTCLHPEIKRIINTSYE